MTEHIRLFIRALLAFTLVGLAERTVLAAHNGGLIEALSVGQVAYALLWGLRYDAAIAAVLAFAALLVAYLACRLFSAPFGPVMRRAAYPLAAILVLMHGADLLYFSEAGRHMGYELRDAWASGAELTAAALGSYKGAVLIQLTLMVPALWLVRHVMTSADTAAQTPSCKRLFPEVQLIVVLLLTVVIARGGLQSIPLEPLHAHELGDSRQAALALNGPYNALYASLSGYTTKRVMQDAPAAADWDLVRGLYGGTGTDQPISAPRNYNVVLVFLEGWSAGLMSAYGHELPTTPVFNALRRQGLTTSAMLAGGQRTTEGMFASLCSAQNPLGNTVARGPLQDYEYHCLPHLLRSAGYETAFFQGTVSGTSGTGAFAQLLGFEQSYGKEHMDLDSLRYEPNSWGVHDPDLYDFVYSKIRRMQAPFFIGINTNTTHDSVLPEGVPPRFDDGLPHGRHLNTINFADHALGEFIEKVKQAPEIGPTYFVLIADHTGPNLGSAWYNFFIPFAIVGPGIEPKEVPVAASQRDLAPTVLALLGRPIPKWFTGQSLLSTDPQRHFADLYQYGQLGWIEGDLLQLIPLQDGGTPRCFGYRTDPGLKKAMNCPPEAAEQRRQALAFTRVCQDLLFRGELQAFAKARDNGVE